MNERSVAMSPNDPCPQVGTDCANMGRRATAVCGVDGRWMQCECDPLPMSCGNGTREGSEECDGNDLNGASCDQLVTGASGELHCDPSMCTYDTSMCVNGGASGSGGGGGGGEGG